MTKDSAHFWRLASGLATLNIYPLAPTMLFSGVAMSAKQRFFWIGVLDAVNYRGMQKISNWPKWKRFAYYDGFQSGVQQTNY